MITDLCRERLSLYNDDDNHWRLANNELYDLVSRYPKHNNKDEIVTKMWVIGRTYAAEKTILL